MPSETGPGGTSPQEPVMVAVRAGGITFAFLLEHVLEIVELASVTPFFHLPPHLLGVTSLRGRVVPVSDPVVLLDLGPPSPDAPKKGVLVRRGSQEVIFSIASVVGTRPGREADLEDLPGTLPAGLRAVARGILPGSPPILLLDTGLLLDLPAAWPCWLVAPS